MRRITAEANGHIGANLARHLNPLLDSLFAAHEQLQTARRHAEAAVGSMSGSPSEALKADLAALSASIDTQTTEQAELYVALGAMLIRHGQGG